MGARLFHIDPETVVINSGTTAPSVVLQDLHLLDADMAHALIEYLRVMFVDESLFDRLTASFTRDMRLLLARDGANIAAVPAVASAWWRGLVLPREGGDAD